MSLGTQLLSGLMDSTYTPSINPDFYGIKDGKPVDKDGNPTTVYHQGNMLQRILSPTARAYSDQNANLASQFATMAPLAQAKQDTDLKLAGNLIDSQPVQNNPYISAFDQTTPEGGHFSPDDTLDRAKSAWASSLVNSSIAPAPTQVQATAQGALNTGLPVQTGAFEQGARNKSAAFQGLIENGKFQDAETYLKTAHQDALNQWAMSNRIEPQKIAIWNETFQREHNRLPTVQDAEDNKAIIDKGVTGAEVNALGNTTKTIGNNALIGATTTGQQVKNLGNTTATMGYNSANDRALAEQLYKDQGIRTGSQRLEDIRNNYELQQLPDPTRSNPWMDNVSVNGVIPSSGVNPRYRMPGAALIGGNGMGSGGGQSQGPTEKLPSGPQLIFPTTDGNIPQKPVTGSTARTEDNSSLIGQSSTGGTVSNPTVNGVPDEAAKDQADREEKLREAVLNHEKEKRNEKIQTLKTEKAALERQHASTGLIANHLRSSLLRPSDFPEGSLAHDIPAAMDSAGRSVGGLIGNANDWLTRKLWTGE